MATFIDLSVLKFFMPIFTSLFIFGIVYGVLSKTKAITDSKNVNAVISITIAIIVLLTEDVVELINFVTPWAILIFVMLFLLIMLLMFAGKEQKEILQYVGGPIFVYIILLLILFIGIGNVFEGVFSPYRNGDQQDLVVNETTGELQPRTTGGETIRTIFHPRVLGAIVILVISAIAVRQITETMDKK